MKIAVVTGASSGIGREFALQIDRREALEVFSSGGAGEIWELRFGSLTSSLDF